MERGQQSHFNTRLTPKCQRVNRYSSQHVKFKNRKKQNDVQTKKTSYLWKHATQRSTKEYTALAENKK